MERLYDIVTNESKLAVVRVLPSCDKNDYFEDEYFVCPIDAEPSVDEPIKLFGEGGLFDFSDVEDDDENYD